MFSQLRQPAILISILFLITSVVAEKRSVWESLDEGLQTGRFKIERESGEPNDESYLFVIRIDPSIWKLNFLSVTASDTVESLENMSVRSWAQKFNLTAAINAGMYDIDYKSHTGYMKIGKHINCARVNKYQSAVAFDPVEDSLPFFHIFDLDVTPLAEVIENYNNVAQNLRLIKRPAENRWSPGERKWSEAALAEDSLGRILFLYATSPYSMYDFNEIILSLPLDIVCAQHLEGGAEAQIYIEHDSVAIGITGSLETNFRNSETSLISWPIPNVLGIRKRQ